MEEKKKIETMLDKEYQQEAEDILKLLRELSPEAKKEFHRFVQTARIIKSWEKTA